MNRLELWQTKFRWLSSRHTSFAMHPAGDQTRSFGKALCTASMQMARCHDRVLPVVLRAGHMQPPARGPSSSTVHP